MNTTNPKTASPEGTGASTRTPANAAITLSVLAVVTWLAGAASDELYPVMAVLAVAGVVLGHRARRSAARGAPGNGRALAAIVLGTVLSCLFLAFVVAALAGADL